MASKDADALDAALQSAQAKFEQGGFSPLSAGLVHGGKTGVDGFGSPADAAMATPSKQLDFGGAGGVTPATPVMNASDDDLDYYLFIKETWLWSNKIRSSFYFVVGLLGWVTLRAVFTSKITLPTGVCYMLLASLMFNFLRAVMAPAFAARCTWSNSSWTRVAAAASSAALHAAAALHDHYLNGAEPLRTLVVGLGLWLLSLLGRAVDALTLLLLLHLATFSVPALYLRFRTQVDAQISKVIGQAKARYDALPRKIKASAVSGVLVLLVLVLPPLDRMVALAILLVYGRAILKPSEYELLAKRVQPVAARMQRVGDKATNLAVGAINKYELTPTPLKKKK